MNAKIRFGFVMLVTFYATAANGAPFAIEPDNYAEGTVVNDVHPQVQLRIFVGSMNDDFPTDFGVFPTPSIIPVTANENVDIFGGHFTSTGIKSFGHANIGFFPESRQLAMRFLAPTSSVAIDFIGRSTLSSQVGVLEIFNGAGTLLDTFTSGPLFSHQVATLSLSRPQADIVYARAFSHRDFSPFGTLDNLRGEIVPEPGSTVVVLIAGVLCALCNRRRST
jgi:hypothetical protein